MKKTIRKLVVRSETLRALDNRDLARAAGGDVVPLRETGRMCASAIFVESGDNCSAATAACG